MQGYLGVDCKISSAVLSGTEGLPLETAAAHPYFRQQRIHVCRTKTEGKPVDSVGKLAARLDDYRVGDKVRVTVSRQGKIRAVLVTLQPGG